MINFMPALKLWWLASKHGDSFTLVKINDAKAAYSTLLVLFMQYPCGSGLQWSLVKIKIAWWGESPALWCTALPCIACCCESEMEVWKEKAGFTGRTVEMHGSIKEMVCPDSDCKTVIHMDDTLMKRLLAREHIACSQCPCPSIRCRIMLYDDKDGKWLPMMTHSFQITHSIEELILFSGNKIQSHTDFAILEDLWHAWKTCSGQEF